ncbi:MAG: hydroxymethylbilane synthase [Pyrinomonas sp.]|uniref:hydroxymethylbilane synthase n=1 Tax=Pyrinomonas sp. TaxID=2080306 RepID=UPI00332408E8
MTAKEQLKLGSRGSPLALRQAELVRARLRALYPHLAFEVVPIRTTGDVVHSAPLSAIGGRGVFTKEIEEALLRGRIDLAVHSLKDLPTTCPHGLVIAATPEREEARDALVLPANAPAVTLKTLARNAVIGTSSPRRAAQLRSVRPDLRLRELRGNVDTRLRKLDQGSYDAIILAAAGLRRLGLAQRISALLETSEILPAVGQGALAIEAREDDADLIALLASLDHGPTRRATAAERAFLRALGGGCQLPIAAHAQCDGRRLRIEGLIASLDGTRIVRERLDVEDADPEEVGAQLADLILRAGGSELLRI